MRLKAQTLPLFSELVNLDKRLPTNTLSQQNRIQRWANFIAGYSIEFTEKCLSKRDNNKDIVIDPFLGCGTTLVACRNLGFYGVGFEQHKLFYMLSKAKLTNYTIEELEFVKNIIQNEKQEINWSNDALKFITKMFSNKDITPIRCASFAIGQIEDKLKPLAIALFLKTCEASCGAQTDGIYKAPTSRKKSIPFNQALESSLRIFKEDILSTWYSKHWVSQPKAECYLKSSENMKELNDSSVGVCITSPPYLNNFDYAEMTRLHLYLLGWANSWKDISETVRNKLITNTTTALKNKKSNEYQNAHRNNLPDEIIAELAPIVFVLSKERKIRAGKKDYDFLVYPYYSQINSVLAELFRILKPGGCIHWVVADAALYGVHIKTHLHTGLLMRNLGFKDVEVQFLRHRGHRWILNKRDGSKEGLGEYHIIARKG
ncbi:MAG: DNA methyltransferase [bacterium]